jgi:hypothetical protein
MEAIVCIRLYHEYHYFRCISSHFIKEVINPFPIFIKEMVIENIIILTNHNTTNNKLKQASMNATIFFKLVRVIIKDDGCL